MPRYSKEEQQKDQSEVQVKKKKIKNLCKKIRSLSEKGVLILTKGKRRKKILISEKMKAALGNLFKDIEELIGNFLASPETKRNLDTIIEVLDALLNCFYFPSGESQQKYLAALDEFIKIAPEIEQILGKIINSDISSETVEAPQHFIQVKEPINKAWLSASLSLTIIGILLTGAGVATMLATGYTGIGLVVGASLIGAGVVTATKGTSALNYTFFGRKKINRALPSANITEHSSSVQNKQGDNGDNKVTEMSRLIASLAKARDLLSSEYDAMAAQFVSTKSYVF